MKKPMNIKKFPNALQKPILKALLFPFGVPPGHSEKQKRMALSRRIEAERFDRLMLLLQHYKIPKSKGRWRLLSYYLACEIFPGMDVVNQIPGRGRPRETFGNEIAPGLLATIDRIRRQNPKLKMDAVIAEAQRIDPRLQKYQPQVVKTRYYELRKRKKTATPVGMLSDLLSTEE